jgi:L-seryl-tRNA(Ser) seleniumtransferase
MSLLALETVLQFYVEGRQDELPVWKALQKSLDQCKLEAEMIMNKMGVGTVIPMQSFSGGGALPNQSIDSFGYFLPTPNCQKISDRLRMGTPSVLVRIQNNGLCIDPRTLLDGELEIILRVFTEVVSPLL